MNESKELDEGPVRWSPATRRWVSLLLIFHLFCVVLAPMAVVEPRSGLALTFHRWLHPYIQSLYLGHGYRFFAPEPGPSHLVQYEITRPSGETVTGHFPDRNRLWPRLLYHRWFMLSETLYQHVSDTLNDQQLKEWRQEVQSEIDELSQTNPRAADALRQDMQAELARHEMISQMRDQLINDLGHQLLRRHDGTSVRLKLLTRLIPPPADIQRGMSLDHERFLPSELQYDLGTVAVDQQQLESIAPLESGDSQGRGEDGE